MDEIRGYIERITFHNDENGYTVAQLQSPIHKTLICIVGLMPGLQPGETVRCKGHWKNHPTHGKQFEVVNFKCEAPSSLIGIKKYLGSGLIKGIGKTYAKKLVDRFGVETLDIIEKNPERLAEIPGFGKKRVDLIRSCWNDQRAVRDIMVFLQGHGVSPGYAQKIFKIYRDQSITKVKDNPYSLARDIHGIGFKMADKVAAELGIAKESDQRIDAGIEYVLTQLSSEGQVCYPTDLFLKEAERHLSVDQEIIRLRFAPLQEEKRIEVSTLIYHGEHKEFIWHRPLFMSELGIARELRRLKKGQSLLRQITIPKAVEWVQDFLKITLAENQLKAVSLAISEKVHIITGGPGTGKSTITNAILTISEKLTSAINLVAPTGRAAKRMSEITGRKATTIHSLLEIDFKTGGFKRNRENPVDCDLIIIDEASMIDTYLMFSLLRALPDHARVIFVGDINQLPSVGPGNVLKDMINSRSLTVTTLNEIFRQAAGSAIITNAHKINKGIYPTLYNGQDSDFFFIEREESQDVLDTIVKLVSQRLPKKYGFDPKQEIQVLSPMKKGVIGVDHLNQALQQMLNPQKMALTRGINRFQVGDKVMQLRNDYKREVFNGDIGFIQDINEDDQQVTVLVDHREILYDYSDLDELTLAYAISIHKFQGSECPCIVIPIHTSHFMMLRRNLLYTAVTRGKKLVVLVGTKKAVAIAIHNDDVQKRYTALQQAIMDIM